MRKTGLFFITAGAALLLSACFMYEDMVFDNPYDPTGQDGITLEYRDDIAIDGDLLDWDNVEPLYTDDSSDTAQNGYPMIAGGDLYQLKAAQDNDTLYFFIESYNGNPLTEPSISVSFDLNESNYGINLFNLTHNSPDGGITSDGTIGFWSRYYDDTGDYDLNNAGIRFAGINESENAIELGISKATYWNYIPSDSGMNFHIGSWYQYHENLYGDGNIDNSNDENTFNILLKSSSDTQPSMDSPIVQFYRGITPTCDDNSLADITAWEEYGYWYQDFVLTDDNSGEVNTDIDKVYIKQDDDYIYFLLTFYDSGSIGAITSVDIYVDQENGAYSHNFYAEYDGSDWLTSTFQVNYNASQDSSGHTGGAGDGFLELRFNKYLAWSDLPYEPCYFNIAVNDSTFSTADYVEFKGMYKNEGDPIPLDQ